LAVGPPGLASMDDSCLPFLRQVAVGKLREE
jgi:hypothetical protein